MEFVFLTLALLIIFYIFLKTQAKFKSSGRKKQEIYKQYEIELLNLLESSSSKEEKIQLKTKFLQKCNSELSRNIFFSEEEAKEVLQKLSSI